MGYIGHSQSERSFDAKQNGIVPASYLAKMLKCSTAAIKAALEPCEWHHTSKHFNKTNFYDSKLFRVVRLYGREHPAEWLDEHGYNADDIETAVKQLEAIREFDAASKKAKKEVTGIFAKIEWIEWGGTRRHPVAHEMEYEGSATIKGDWITFDGKRKKLSGKHITVTERKAS